MIQPLLKRDALELDPAIEAARHEIENAELEQWWVMFETGHDYFYSLPNPPTSPHGWLRETRPAWNKLGDRFLAERKPDPHRQPWALKRFGVPGDKSTKALSSHRHKKW